jgi:hypothetical protein
LKDVLHDMPDQVAAHALIAAVEIAAAAVECLDRVRAGSGSMLLECAGLDYAELEGVS